MERLLKFTNTRSRASVMVDAAICIPLFVISMAMMLEVINISGKEENAFYEAEKRIQTVGSFGSELELGATVDDPEKGVYLDHVQSYPILKNIKFPFAGAFFKSIFLTANMPYRTYIGESPDKYSDCEFVYIFPKNEGSEKETPKYHKLYCTSMKGGATKGLEIEKLSLKEAEERGYALCKHCSAKLKN